MIAPDLQAADGPHIEGIEELLGVKGTTISPTQIDKSHVGFIMDVGAGGFGRMTRKGIADDSRALVGLTSLNIPVLGPSGWTISGLAVLMGLTKQSGRILGMNHGLNFDAAGALAFNGKTVRVTWRYVDFLNGGASCVICITDKVIATGTLGYDFPVPLEWHRLVPWDMGLQALVSSVDSTVFPAATVVSTRASAWVSKLGKQSPF